MELREQIAEYLHNRQFEIVSRTCDLVKIPSINVRDDSDKPYGRQCAKALDYLQDLCREKDLIAENFDYHCLEVKCDNNRSGKRLVIATHADVVTAEDDHIYAPFAGSVYGDYIIGRGVVDDKGPLMASLYALAFFKEYGIPLKNDIRLFFGSNEECGMDDLDYYLKIAGQPDWGLAVDDDFPAVNGEKGLVQFTIAAPKSAHAEMIRSFGPNQRIVHDFCETTIDGANTVLKRSEKIPNPVLYAFTQSGVPLFRDPEDAEKIIGLLQDTDGSGMGICFCDEMSGKTSVKVIRAQTAGENIELTFDVRIPVSADAEEVADSIRAYAERQKLAVRIEKVSRGYYLTAEHPMISMLTDLYNNEANADDKPYVMGGCTYARKFDHGCGFGAGNPHEVKPLPKGHGGCHGADEAHHIQVLLDAVKMLILGIKAIDDQWSETNI